MTSILIASTLLIQMASAITCVALGQSSTATWTDSLGRVCTYSGIVGTNFGNNSISGRNYGCQGRCGASCATTPFIGNHYTANCYAHDVCSWFENSIGGELDPNCGTLFRNAIGDFLLGEACNLNNPVLPVTPPTTTPVCKYPNFITTGVPSVIPATTTVFSSAQKTITSVIPARTTTIVEVIPSPVPTVVTNAKCSHSVCKTGNPLNGQCDLCSMAINLLDPFVFWDDTCVQEVASICFMDCLSM